MRAPFPTALAAGRTGTVLRSFSVRRRRRSPPTLTPACGPTRLASGPRLVTHGWPESEKATPSRSASVRISPRCCWSDGPRVVQAPGSPEIEGSGPGTVHRHPFPPLSPQPPGRALVGVGDRPQSRSQAVDGRMVPKQLPTQGATGPRRDPDNVRAGHRFRDNRHPVATGSPIGTLEVAGSHCLPRACMDRYRGLTVAMLTLTIPC